VTIETNAFTYMNDEIQGQQTVISKIRYSTEILHKTFPKFIFHCRDKIKGYVESGRFLPN
jgi:hypothetical protein